MLFYVNFYLFWQFLIFKVGEFVVVVVVILSFLICRAPLKTAKASGLPG